MDTDQAIRLMLDGINTFGAFAVLVVTTVIVFVLWKRKEGGAGGAFMLMLARTGVWLSALCFGLLHIFRYELDFETEQWIGIGLRIIVLLSTVMSGIAFLLIKPAATSPSNQEATHE